MGADSERTFPHERRIMLKKKNKLQRTLTTVDGEIIVVFQTLIACESSNARFALALTRLAVASLRRQRTHHVALAVTTASVNISISILRVKK